MFGNDDKGGGDNRNNGPNLGSFLFAMYIWREMEAGRLTAGDIFKVLFWLAAIAGGGLLVIWIWVGLSTPRYNGLGYPSGPGLESPGGFVPGLTLAPVWTPRQTAATWPSTAPTAVPTPTPKPTPAPHIGTRVAMGGGWTVQVVKVGRWAPSWYHEPGWHLITVYVKVWMPEESVIACVWGNSYSVTAPGGNQYTGYEALGREPSLFACVDYHRPTTATGWLTFEVRDRDAKGLMLDVCAWDADVCGAPNGIKIS